MILVGLTGGIGSGKSTVSAALAARGAVIVDADQVVRDVQQPGSPVLAKLAERFGAQVIAADGSLDRPALAAIAFADPDALKDLNGIVHPAVGAEMNRQVMQHVASEVAATISELFGQHVVVNIVPVLTEQRFGVRDQRVEVRLALRLGVIVGPAKVWQAGCAAEHSGSGMAILVVVSELHLRGHFAHEVAMIGIRWKGDATQSIYVQFEIKQPRR